MSGFRLRGYHPLRPTFPSMFCYPSIVSLLCGPTTPARRCHRPGLGSCAFARRYWRNHVCFLFLRVLRCFSSPGWRPAWRDGTRSVPGCPIRTSAGLRVFAPLRGFSQLVTSFFASESQGILHAPFSPFLFSFFRESRLFVRVPLSSLRVTQLLTEGFICFALEFCLVARIVLVCVHSRSLHCVRAPKCLRCFHNFQHVNVLFSKSGE